jgi:glycine cleavage system aminomethyltransferase T
VLGVRNAAGFFDTSPLNKYWIRGRDAELLCSYAFARDIRSVRPGRAQYTRGAMIAPGRPGGRRAVPDSRR